MNKYQNELELFSAALTEKQRLFLKELLQEERDNIEPYIQQNMWVIDRVKIIDSIIQLLENINTRKR